MEEPTIRRESIVKPGWYEIPFGRFKGLQSSIRFESVEKYDAFIWMELSKEVGKSKFGALQAFLEEDGSGAWV